MRRGEAARTPEATFELGWRTATGAGVPQSDGEAARLYHIAADQGHVEAQAVIGAYYGRGGVGTQQNDREAFRYTRLAADQV
mmetsp:Transcript_20729/g.48655  ORF Transcript_20729/g.48655 Transcript_20729/m.48655 type:complete len:82 (+) Transcript_20729:164-409(+)